MKLILQLALICAALSATPVSRADVTLESLKISAISEGMPAELQDMSPWDNARWSKGHQLVMKPKQTGSFVELEVPASDAQPRQIILYATQAPDFGILKITVNGQPSAATPDLWAEHVQPAEPVKLGVFTPRDGRFFLRAEVTGANPKSKGARIFYGLDCLVLEPPFPEWGLGPFAKHPRPVLSPNTASKFTCPVLRKEVRWEEQNVYNPAAVVRDGKVYLFYRADDRNPALKWGRTCRIGMAWSEDGTNFTRHPTPVLYPDNDEWKKYEWEGGCEDLHIVEDESGTAYLNYTTWNGRNDSLFIATSRDLVHWKKHGPAFAKADRTDGRSGVVVSRLVGDRLLAARIDGKYWMYYTHPCALAWSDNLIDWTPTGKAVWPGGGREAGALALLRDDGILLMTQGGHATLGAWTLRQALLDRSDLTSILREQNEPFLWPEFDWEKRGFTGDTTVANTLVPFHGKWRLYYGGADRQIGLATFAPLPSPARSSRAAEPGTVEAPPNAPATVEWNATAGRLNLRYHGVVILDATVIAEAAYALTETETKLSPTETTGSRVSRLRVLGPEISRQVQRLLYRPRDGCQRRHGHLRDPRSARASVDHLHQPPHLARCREPAQRTLGRRRPDPLWQERGYRWRSLRDDRASAARVQASERGSQRREGADDESN